MDALWMPIREVAGVVYPRRPTALGWCLHAAFWCVSLVVLWQLNRWVELDRLLRSPWPMLHHIWLPLLAAAVYLLGWLGVGLWETLRPEPKADALSAVESAWREASQHLQRAGIDPYATPAYLIVGTRSAEFDAVLADMDAVALAHGAAWPIQVFAQRHALFIAAHALLEETPLAEVCRILRTECAPRQPVQGIIVAVLGAGDAMQTCRADLQAIRQATGLELPIYVAVSGLSQAADIHWLQRFPLRPDLDNAAVAAMYRHGIDWLFLERVAQQARPLLQCDPAALSENAAIYQRMIALQAWRAHLKGLLIDVLQTDDGEPGMVAGCYLLPAPEDAAALAQALYADLQKNNAAGRWTAETSARHATQRRQLMLGYAIGLGAMAVLALGMALIRTFA